MSQKKVPDTYVTQRFCDMCGELIDDGKEDGMGGIHFWGTFVRMQKAEQKKIEIETDRLMSTKSLIIRIPYGFLNEKTWEVCLSCADKVKLFIESEALKNEK